MRVQDVVMQVLTDYPKTRSNDLLLEYHVCKMMGLPTDLYELSKLEENKLCGIERTRRKIQEQYPNLRPSEATEKNREEKEFKYLDYARNYEDNLFTTYNENKGEKQ